MIRLLKEVTCERQSCNASVNGVVEESSQSPIDWECQLMPPPELNCVDAFVAFGLMSWPRERGVLALRRRPRLGAQFLHRRS
jgi:hypothetical protein